MPLTVTILFTPLQRIHAIHQPYEVFFLTVITLWDCLSMLYIEFHRSHWLMHRHQTHFKTSWSCLLVRRVLLCGWMEDSLPLLVRLPTLYKSKTLAFSVMLYMLSISGITTTFSGKAPSLLIRVYVLLACLISFPSTNRDLCPLLLFSGGHQWRFLIHIDNPSAFPWFMSCWRWASSSVL